MREMIEEFIRDYPTTFEIFRNGARIGVADGYNNSNDRVIFFRAGEEVREGDWAVAGDTQARFYVKQVDLLPDQGRSAGTKVFYEIRTDYERAESATQLIAMLDDIADAVWTLSDKKMPPQKKQRVQDAVEEIQGALRSMPAGAAGGLAGQITERLLGS